MLINAFCADANLDFADSNFVLVAYGSLFTNFGDNAFPRLKLNIVDRRNDF